MRQVMAIARNTFREAVRDRIFHGLVGFAVLLVLSSLVIGIVTVGDKARIVTNVGLAAVHLFAVLTAISVGTGLVYKEMSKRTIYTILSKPVARYEFILGKYAGLMGVLVVELAFLAIVFHVPLALAQEGGSFASALHPETFQAIFMMGVELAVVTSVVLLFSTFTGPFTGGLLSLLFFIIGHSIAEVAKLTERFDTEFEAKMRATAGHRIWTTIAEIFPDLERFNLKEEAVYAIHVPAMQILQDTTYGLILSAMFVAGACLIFSRRDFS